jgi:predicted nucleic acid-binding protein
LETGAKYKTTYRYRDRKELIEALTMFANKNIDIVDCILCVKAKSYNMSLFSFDNGAKRLCETG